MWGGGNGTGNKTNIEEANRHLQLLTNKVAALEEHVKKQEVLLEEKEEQMRAIVHDITMSYEEQMKSLQEVLAKTESKARKMEDQLDEKEREVTALRQRSRLMDELVRYKSTLAKLTITLEQAESHNNYVIQRQVYGHGNDTDQTPTLGEQAAKSLNGYNS